MRSILFRGLLSAVFFLAATHPAAAGIDRWTPIGPEGGLIRSLAAAPGAPGTLYAGTYGGGVWQSLDGGGTWAPTPGGLGAGDILYLAASAGRVYAGAYEAGLYLWTGGAAPWRQVGPLGFAARALAVDPTSSDRIWAVGYNPGTGAREVLLSQDGGEHWSVKLSLLGDLYDVAVAPTVPPTVYAAGDSGVLASTDEGATWRQLTLNFSDPASGPSVAVSLVVDPREPKTLYVVSYNGLWRTTDTGAHWSLAGAINPFPLIALPGVLLGGVASAMVLRSEDGGASWDPVERLPTWSFDCFEADPAAPGGAWVAGSSSSSEGLLRTADGGVTWTRTGRGLKTTDVRAFAFDPFLPRALYVATRVARLQRSFDAGASWSPTLSHRDIHALAADPLSAGILYAGTPRGVLVSLDQGAHFRRSLSDPQGIETVIMDPRRPGTIWAAGKRVWRSRDGGTTWKRQATPIHPESSATALKIYLSPWHPKNHPATLYFIDAYLTLSRSTDDGASWERLEGSVIALAFDPRRPGLVYRADYGGAIRKSLDGGTTWEQVASAAGGNAPLTTLLLDRRDPSVLYVGTAGNGVWRSRDHGVTWQPFSAGLLAPVITCLEADPRNPRRLVACTQGGGLQEIRISSEP